MVHVIVIVCIYDISIERFGLKIITLDYGENIWYMYSTHSPIFGFQMLVFKGCIAISVLMLRFEEVNKKWKILDVWLLDSHDWCSRLPVYSYLVKLVFACISEVQENEEHPQVVSWFWCPTKKGKTNLHLVGDPYRINFTHIRIIGHFNHQQYSLNLLEISTSTMPSLNQQVAFWLKCKVVKLHQLTISWGLRMSSQIWRTHPKYHERSVYPWTTSCSLYTCF